jgi:hypothetical protein
MWMEACPTKANQYQKAERAKLGIMDHPTQQPYFYHGREKWHPHQE